MFMSQKKKNDGMMMVMIIKEPQNNLHDIISISFT